MFIYLQECEGRQIHAVTEKMNYEQGALSYKMYEVTFNNDGTITIEVSKAKYDKKNYGKVRL